MKRIIYFLLIVLVSALYSCSEQYDNINKYATDETVYVGKYSDDAYIRIGYKRIEIELLGDSIGRALTDDIYLGKAKKTVIEYDESDGLRKIEIDSVCSWVNITGLTTAKTYIFNIYTEDNDGHKSASIEALGKPYTDDDFAGIAFPLPHVISTPSTVEIIWDEVSMGLSSPLFKFVELIYSYVDRDNNMVSGKLTENDNPSFNMKNLKVSDSTAFIINCRIIPIMESGRIIDTLSMVREFYAITSEPEQYLKDRTVRPIKTALINPHNETEATVTFDNKTDHLLYTEIRYLQTAGEYNVIRIENDRSEALCPDIKRRETIQIRGAYNPPETSDIFISEWEDYAPFILKYDMKDWVVIPRTGNHPWGSDGSGSQNLWDGGHPMLILDDDPRSGWHSRLGSPLPQVLVIDMKEPRRISKVFAFGGYWKTVELYLTNDPSLSGYTAYTVDWNDGAREGNYNSWVNPFSALIPDDVPESWGHPVAQVTENELMGQQEGEKNHTFTIPQGTEGRFLIMRFPNSTTDATNTYIDVLTFEAYSD
jgi:hypothetical protein